MSVCKLIVMLYKMLFILRKIKAKKVAGCARKEKKNIIF